MWSHDDSADKSAQRGSGLLEVVIMSGVLLTIIGFMYNSFSNYKKFQKYTNMRTNELFLTDYIKSAADCEGTFLALGGSCSYGENIEVLSHLDFSKPLVKVSDTADKNYTKIGSYQVRAICLKNNNIKLEKRLVNDSNKPVKHPLRKGLNKWTRLGGKNNLLCNL